MLAKDNWDYSHKFNTYIGSNTESIVPKKSDLVDSDWLEGSLFSIMTEENYGVDELKALYRAKVEFQDMSTVPGAHIAINPPWGWNPNADPHYPGKSLFNSDSVIENVSPYIGLGRYYSDAIQSHLAPRMLTISAGVPDFKNIFAFYMGAVDSMKAMISASGRSSALYSAARTATSAYGLWALIRVFPMITMAYVLVTTTLNVIYGMGSPNYYSLKPTMDLYLNSAGQILNTLAVNRGILELIDVDKGAVKGSDDTRLMSPVKVHRADIEELNRLMPGIVDDNGFINIYAIVGGYQRRRLREIATLSKYINRAIQGSSANYHEDYTSLIHNLNEDIAPEDYAQSGIGTRDKAISDLAEISNTITEYYNGMELDKAADKVESEYDFKIPDAVKEFLAYQIKPVYHDPTTHKGDFLELKRKVRELKSRKYEYNVGKTDKDPTDPNLVDATETEKINRSIEDGLKDIYAQFKAGINDGVEAVNFIVDYEGSTTDSFSNSVKDIPISAMVNGMSSTIRDARFSASGGNMLGDGINTVIHAAADVVSGAIDGLTIGLSGLMRALTGSAYINFDKMIGDSTADVGTHQFKIRLGSPVSNPLALMTEVDVVLSLIMAAMLPHRVGRASSSTPYLISAFLPGQVNITKGVMTSLSINRGVGATQYTNEGQPTDLEIRFSIVDLEPGPSVAIPSGSITDAFELALDDHAPINKYLQTIAGMGYTDTRHVKNKAILRANKLYGTFANYTNPAAIGTMLSYTTAGRMLAAVVPDNSPLTNPFN